MERQANHQKHKKQWTIEDVNAFCGNLLNKMQLNLSHECREDEGAIIININGPDRQFLLSNTATLLNNMEYLFNITFPGYREETPFISLDSDHYRKHRELELKLLAEMASKKVLAGRKPLNLQPMIPRERRIIHMTLAAIEGVQSKSEGEGDHRSITIYPTE
jgi:spoIIIJ-associated protein